MSAVVQQGIRAAIPPGVVSAPRDPTAVKLLRPRQPASHRTQVNSAIVSPPNAATPPSLGT